MNSYHQERGGKWHKQPATTQDLTAMRRTKPIQEMNDFERAGHDGKQTGIGDADAFNRDPENFEPSVVGVFSIFMPQK